MKKQYPGNAQSAEQYYMGYLIHMRNVEQEAGAFKKFSGNANKYLREDGPAKRYGKISAKFYEAEKHALN